MIKAGEEVLQWLAIDERLSSYRMSQTFALSLPPLHLMSLSANALIASDQVDMVMNILFCSSFTIPG